MFALDRGKELFKRNGSRANRAHPATPTPDTIVQTWAAHMPRVESRLNRVVGRFEEFITRHARPTTGDEMPNAKAMIM
jgi:hypothetical protein